MAVQDGARAGAKVAGNPNQVQIPVIQNKDGNLTQVQQHANKVFRNLNNQIVMLQNDVNQMTIVGEIKIASLTLAQFQETSGDTWIEANGQSSVGTKYETLTGNKTVPTITVVGANSFIKVN